MNIRISRLELTNFKCFRHKELTFEPDVTTIRGRNGVGKTTIADAILWCLFGKNSAGQTTFDLKTHDDQGKTIPHLDHSVEITLHVYPSDGSDVRCINIRRSLKESWVKKRGATEETLKGHTTEFLVNGDSMPPKDYEKYISSLINEDLFRTITNPSFFPSKKWQEQRAFLAGMVGTIAPEEIATTHELSDLVKSLSDTPEGVDIIAYRKHLAYQIKQIKDKLDRIPVRLEEQNKALPEKLDWYALEAQCAEVSRQQKEVSEKIIAIKSGNGGDVLREEIRKEIRATITDMEKIETEQRKLLRLRQDEQDHAIQTARQQFNNLVSTQRDLEASIPSFDTLAKRCRETAETTFKKEQKYVRTHWAETQARFEDSDSTICPVCGQPLPPDMLAEKESLFNQTKARLKAELTERAYKAKQLLVDAETEAKNYEAQKAEAEKNLADTKAQINAAFSHKQKLEKVILPALDEILKGHPQYLALSAKLKEQQAKLDSVAITQDDNTQLADLEAKKAEYTQILSEVQAQLATKSQYDRIQQLIAGIEQERKDLMAQLSELEKKEDTARYYQDRQNTILEERVNQHFKLVRWKMFRTVVNNGDPFQEPYCECYVNGVAYRDGLNQAARLNAGLDIINTLCRHYQVSAPIVIDNSESNLNILPTASQQIRLQVADTDLQAL